MYSYNVIQWLFIFYFYCFFGWCFESVYVSIRHKRWVNRGFMRGPFLPLYGSGALMMLLVSAPFQENIVLTFISGFLGATALEYVTGVLMEKLFQVRYWDYSDQRLQFQGHISLTSSLAWGGLTILMTEVVHRGVEKVVLAIPMGILAVVTILLTIYITSDFALSFRDALDLKEILVRMEKIKEELLQVQKRLDTIIGAVDSGFTARKAALSETIGQAREGLADKLRVEELKKSIEEKLNALKEAGNFRYSDEMKEEIGELRFRYRLMLDLSERLSVFRKFYRSRIIHRNPTMSSKSYNNALEELKELPGDDLPEGNLSDTEDSIIARELVKEDCTEKVEDLERVGDFSEEKIQVKE